MIGNDFRMEEFFKAALNNTVFKNIIGSVVKAGNHKTYTFPPTSYLVECRGLSLSLYVC